MDLRNKIFVLSIAIATASFAAKYEGESATLSDGAKAVTDSDASGTGYASMESGNITFEDVSVETAGKYTLTLHYKAPDYKQNFLKVNGATAGALDFEKSDTWIDVSTAVTLKAGKNTIAIERSWG